MEIIRNRWELGIGNWELAGKSQFQISNFKFLFSLSISFLLFLSCSAQRFGYKDRSEGDTVTFNKQTYTIHKVKKDETVFTIAAKYHVTVNDLDKANKDVINNLKKNTVLLIPISKKNEEVKKKEEVKAISYKDQVFKIVLLIPFNENINFSVDSTLANGYSLNSELEKETIANLEFYEGVVIALDSLNKNGLKAHITVVDAYDSASVANAKLKAEVRNADVLVTNLNQALSGMLSNYSSKGTPLIISCGTNSSVSLKGDSTAFFTTPSSLLQCKEMGEYYAKEKLAGNRFIFIKTSSQKETERVNAFKNELNQEKGIDIAVFDTTSKQLKTIDASMIKGKNNIIILPSTNEAFVSNIISALKTLNKEYEITLSGLPTWQHFESVNPEDLQTLHTEIFSAVNIAYQSPQVLSFRKTFLEKYSTEPSENAFTGYDTMLLLGEQLISHGTSLCESLPDKNYTGLSTSFHFVKQPDVNGFENNYISILRFENYALKKVNR